ncbi:MAG: hypothetical protein FWB85_01330 [Chitinispirillia bacterium]|nr:hypothetical protein [Chitinispirillia bacterium]MCL2241369.1 hypothetical protein [Chitinispirillia bacterium]
MCRFQVKGRVLSMAAAGCLLVAGVAGADQCAVVDEAQAAKAQAILAERPMVLHYCEPCGEKEPGAPYAVDTVGVAVHGEGKREISINGKKADFAYIFVRVEAGKYDNMALLIGCPAKDVSQTLAVAGEGAEPAEEPVVEVPAAEPPHVVAAPIVDTSVIAEPVTTVPQSGMTASYVSGGRMVGTVYFYRHGSRIMNSTLSIFDAGGNLVKRIAISERVRGDRESRAVGSWDLTSMTGRTVRAGTYTATGRVASRGGKEEEVSVKFNLR